MMKKLIHKMSELTSIETTTIAIIFLFSITSFVNQSCSARTLTNISPTHNFNLNHSHLHKLTFLMPHVLNTSLIHHHPSSSTINDLFPFSSKPLSISSPTSSESTIDNDDRTRQALDLISSMGFLFPSKEANLQDLELGKTTLIQEELLQQVDGTFHKFGKAEGMYVMGRSVDNNGIGSYMLALTVNFGEVGDDDEDGLRLFGEQRSDVIESHVAVIGGRGKYEDANGYASVKVVQRVGFSQQHKGIVTSSMLLSFDVYLL